MVRIITFGVFDYFHLGHLRLFKQCKEYGDYLVVAVQDGNYIKKFKPEATVLYSTEERVEILNSIREVDEVLVYKECTKQTLEKLEFDVLALGEDHVGERFKEMEDWCNKNGKRVVYLKRTQGISSSQIKGKIN